MAATAKDEVVAAPERRRYESPRRRMQAEQTRRAILDAATDLFTATGWSTGIRDVARTAGVSVETVYANFASKADLLHAVLDVAIVGDDEPVALMERPEFAEIATGAPRDRAAAAAKLMTSVNRRTAGLQRALREAAVGGGDLATRLGQARGRQRITVRAGGELIAGRALSVVEADGLWAVLSMEVYELLLGTAGWSSQQYEDWLAGATVALLDIKD